MKTLITTFVLFDLLILFVGLAQIGVEGRSGDWSPFWRVQAEFVINHLQVR